MRFIWCARVAVTFLRGRWLERAVDFLCAVAWIYAPVLDFCVVVFRLVVADEDFFFCGVDVLSCANSPLPSKTSTEGQKNCEKAFVSTHPIQCSAISCARVSPIRYRMDSHL